MIEDTKIDAVKFFLIFCVALGHCLGQFWDKTYVLSTYNFIYLFHMPLFIFISGYFTKNKSLFSREFWISEIKILETFLVFDILHRIPSFFDGSFTLHDMIVPSWSLWYLLSLFYWRFIIQILTSAIKNKKALIVVAFVFGLSIGFVPLSGALSIQRTLSFLPFFVIGYCVSQNNLIEKIRAVNHFVAIGICAIAFVASYAFLNFDIHDVVWGLRPYAESNFGVKEAFAFRALYYVIGLLLSFSIINLFKFNNAFFAAEGRKTLIYYMYHTFLLLGVFKAIQYLDIPVNLGTLIFFTVLVMAVIYIISKFKPVLWLLNPVTSILLRNKKRPKNV